MWLTNVVSRCWADPIQRLRRIEADNRYISRVLTWIIDDAFTIRIPK
jgi:hypothetical protein